MLRRGEEGALGVERVNYFTENLVFKDYND